jgi:diguanylate cyclase (GGDEF)-like protein/PAS domain S-box-containing protein
MKRPQRRTDVPLLALGDAPYQHVGRVDAAGDTLWSMQTSENRRVLLVDDTPAIHQDFRKILAPEVLGPAREAAEAPFFGKSEHAVVVYFELDSALQGAEAIEKVRAAFEADRAFAMAFVDMRMPPGFDGVETVERLWRTDPRLQVVLCTAYSDYSWPEVLHRLDVRDRLLFLKKPFDSIEVFQLANALTAKWNASRQAAFKMDTLERAVQERTRQLTDANIIVQNSPVILYRLRGEPSFSLVYVSQNITRLGYEAETLVASPNWAQQLIHRDDLARVGEAMARMMDKDARASSIEFRMCTADGGWRWVDNRYTPVRDKEGRLIEVEGVIIDVTERKAAEEQVALLARTDQLTGLANRSTFLERLHQVFAACGRGAKPFAILYLDLDQFKPVNDTLGHPAGDSLLREVAVRLGHCVRESDLIARLGGDEFAILQCEIREPANAGELASKIQSALACPYNIDGQEVSISVSIGICPYDSDVADADEMLSKADRALYRAKERGRNRYQFHSDDLDQEVLERVTLAGEMRSAIEKGELELQYQPQVELSSRAIVGMEALVRWNHPRRGLLAPGIFIPIAERTGVIVALGNWVLDQACRQMRNWRDAGLTLPLMAVNISLLQLQRGPELLHDVRATLAKWNLLASDLEFDVTEATLAQLKWSQNDVLSKLRELGVKIAIDNFGSEYSSFDYVRAYQINHLKIARSFIDSSCTDPTSAAMITAIINFAREVGVGVIAQGVETDEQRALLTSADSSARAQGFHFSKAVGAADAGELLRRGLVVGRDRRIAHLQPRRAP